MSATVSPVQDESLEGKAAPQESISAGCEAVYALVDSSVDIHPLDSSSVSQKYVVRNSHGKSYVVSEGIRELILLFEGAPHTLNQIAAILSERRGVTVPVDRLKQAVDKYLVGYGLVREVKQGDDTLSGPGQHSTASKKSRPFDFVFRLSLISPKLAAPIVNKLTWLFKPVAALVSLFLIFAAHFVFYANWFQPRPRISFGPGGYLIFYAIGLATVLFHEFGHASACRYYRCEHGAIGFLVYLVIPAFFINLSPAWRLPGKQRAVIDVGGVYFQLLTIIPLSIAYVFTGNHYFSATVYAVDWMVLFSLNPILKFDGYWLLVDLTGLVNLQKRGWRVMKEILSWSLGIGGGGVPVLKDVPGTWKKIVLVMYSFITVCFFTSLILLISTFAPAQLVRLGTSARDVARSWEYGPVRVIFSLGRLAMNVFFILFIYRLLSSTVFKLFRSSRRKAA